MHNIKKTIIVFVATVILTMPIAASAELIDRVVAVVNNDVITLSDLNREGQPVFQKIRHQVSGPDLDKAILNARGKILDRLIDRRVMEQHAEKMGVAVTDQEVSAAIDRILQENHATRKNFDMQLKAIGTSESEYRVALKDQILQSKLVSYEIRSKIVITDQEIKDYYDKNYAAKVQEGSYHILQIGITWNDQDPDGPKTAERHADGIREMAIKGKDFSELAHRYSDLPSAEDGGDIGVFKKEELAPYMKKSILTMHPGEISPVIETPAGFQLFKLLSDKGNVNASASYDSVKEKIKNLLYRQEAEKQYKKWVTELRDQAYVKKLL